MSKELNTLLTALYVFIDDHVVAARCGRGRRPELSDSELVTLAVAQALLGFHSERRWIRHLHASPQWQAMFPHLPGQSGYHKRLKRARPSDHPISSASPLPASPGGHSGSPDTCASVRKLALSFCARGLARDLSPDCAGPGAVVDLERWASGRVAGSGSVVSWRDLLAGNIGPGAGWGDS